MGLLLLFDIKDEISTCYKFEICFKTRVIVCNFVMSLKLPQLQEYPRMHLSTEREHLE